jgi:hypothetical protein
MVNETNISKIKHATRRDENNPLIDKHVDKLSKLEYIIENLPHVDEDSKKRFMNIMKLSPFRYLEAVNSKESIQRTAYHYFGQKAVEIIADNL